MENVNFVYKGEILFTQECSSVPCKSSLIRFQDDIQNYRVIDIVYEYCSDWNATVSVYLEKG